VNHLSLSGAHVVRGLTATAVLLIAASVLGQLVKHVLHHDTVFGLVPLFYLDAEGNVPSFFSAVLMLTAALLLAAVATLKTRTHDADAFRWTALAFTFVFLAVDEAAGIHELLSEPTRRLLGQRASGILYFAWVVPGVAGTLALGLYFLGLVVDLPVKTRRLIVLAAGLFLGGALGMELVGGWHYEQHGDDLAFSMIATVEESLEMAGAITFIRALLGYLSTVYPVTQITLKSDL
jgi:hypothetical protein